MTDEPMTVAELEALLEGTTPGPWRGVSGAVIIEVSRASAVAGSHADARLIAAAPSLAAALIAALGERDEALARAENLSLALIEARNPGIDMDEVRRTRGLAAHPVAPQPEEQ